MKRIINQYTFDASAKTIVFDELLPVGAELTRIMLITNVTDNIIIYQFNDNTLGGTLTDNTLTLTYDTTTMSDSDVLAIIYEDEGLPQKVDQRPLLKDVDSVTTHPSEVQYTSTGTGLNNNVIVLTTVGYAWISLQIQNPAAGSSWVGDISFEGSNDGNSWFSVGLLDTAQLGSFALDDVTSNRLLGGPVGWAFFRAKFTSWTSGTAMAVAYLSTVPRSPHTIGGAVGISNTPFVKLDATSGMTFTNHTVGIYPKVAAITTTSVTAVDSNLFGSFDMANYSHITLTVAGTFTGTLTVQYADDNAGFSAFPSIYGPAGEVTDTITAAGQYVIKGPAGRYIRLRSTAWTSGTATATATAHTNENSVLYRQGVSQQGTWNTSVQASSGHTTTSVTTSSTQIIAANANRKGLIISNAGF